MLQVVTTSPTAGVCHSHGHQGQTRPITTNKYKFHETVVAYLWLRGYPHQLDFLGIFFSDCENLII
jgi:hypothetical protein